MTLPELLSELSELLPERVFDVGYTVCRVMLEGQDIVVDLEGEGHSLLLLEGALREECTARGWTVLLDLRPELPRVTLYAPEFQSAAIAATPAEALVLAVLAVLKSEARSMFIQINPAPENEPRIEYNYMRNEPSMTRIEPEESP